MASVETRKRRRVDGDGAGTAGGDAAAAIKPLKTFAGVLKSAAAPAVRAAGPCVAAGNHFGPVATWDAEATRRAFAWAAFVQDSVLEAKIDEKVLSSMLVGALRVPRGRQPGNSRAQREQLRQVETQADLIAPLLVHVPTTFQQARAALLSVLLANPATPTEVVATALTAMQRDTSPDAVVKHVAGLCERSLVVGHLRAMDAEVCQGAGHRPLEAVAAALTVHLVDQQHQQHVFAGNVDWQHIRQRYGPTTIVLAIVQRLEALRDDSAWQTRAASWLAQHHPSDFLDVLDGRGAGLLCAASLCVCRAVVQTAIRRLRRIELECAGDDDTSAVLDQLSAVAESGGARVQAVCIAALRAHTTVYLHTLQRPATTLGRCNALLARLENKEEEEHA
eukprot:m.490843 g.490843  ORF g.490843 m.490843 type:complete len:392 (-) comp28744_c0_seq1:29-1204(-)